MWALALAGLAWMAVPGAAGLAASGDSTGDGGEAADALRFLQERQARRPGDVPRLVLAFYYPWYGHVARQGRWIHWDGVNEQARDIASSTHYPLLGPYDSQDPEVVDRHFAWAKEAGIDGFIVSWWGPGDFTDKAMPLLLDKAAAHGLKLSVYWETVPYQTASERVRWGTLELAYLLRQYGRHSAFLQVNGQPVVFVYGRVMGQVGFAEWPAIIRGAEQAFGGPFLLIADGIQRGNAALFDGVHSYNPVGWVAGTPLPQLGERSRQVYADEVQVARRAGKIATVTVIPGYDDTKIRKPGLKAERHGGQTYRTLWEAAIAAAPDWVLITSFNEWHEGSEIEPSWEDGDRYLQLTRQLTAAFKASPAPSTRSAAGIDPQLKQQLQAAWAGKTIGVLPDLSPMSPVVYWLGEMGLPLRFLDRREVAGGLDPAQVPVVLYAGGEHFQTTLTEPNDVVEGLRAYLRRGGVLVAAAGLPLPFYYDSTGRAVKADTALGFRIFGTGQPPLPGWERPPAGAELHFEVNQAALAGVEPKLAFPAGGDLRWRPMGPVNLAAEDAYVSLVTLKGADGRNYGDAAAYLEHRGSEPRGGKNLYIWFRLLDHPEADQLLAAIFQFVAAHAGGGR